MRGAGYLLALATFGMLTVVPSAFGDPVVLTLEGIPNYTAVDRYYQRFGIVFSPSMGAIIDSDEGGSAVVANEPSPNTVLYLGLTDFAGRTYVDVSRGFTSRFSFWYSQPSSPDPDVVTSHFQIDVFDGPHGTGQRLGHWTLSQTDPFAPGDPTGGAFGDWHRFDERFDGVARSLTWTEPRNLGGAAFDNLEFRLADVAPTPEPSTVLLVGAAAVLWRVRRKRPV